MQERTVFRGGSNAAKPYQSPPWQFTEPKSTAIKTLIMASQRYLAIRAAAPEGMKQASISPCFPLADRTERALDYAITRARGRWGNAPVFELVSADALPFRSGAKIYPPEVAVLQNATAIMTMTMREPAAFDATASTLTPDMGSDAELLQTFTEMNTREVE